MSSRVEYYNIQLVGNVLGTKMLLPILYVQNTTRHAPWCEPGFTRHSIVLRHVPMYCSPHFARNLGIFDCLYIGSKFFSWILSLLDRSLLETLQRAHVDFLSKKIKYAYPSVLQHISVGLARLFGDH